MPITGMTTTSVKAGYNAILSNLAQGHTNNDFVGKYICPLVSVTSRTGLVFRFDDSAFERYNDNRAAGGPFNVIEVGYDSVPYALANKGLAYKVPEEEQEEAANAGIQYGRDVAQPALSQAEDLNLEIEQMQLVTNTANYGSLTAALSGTDRFDDAASKPSEIIMDAMNLCIARPNVILAGPEVADALKRNPEVKAQFQPTSSASITETQLATYFGVEKFLVGRARWRNPSTNTKDFIWGKNLIMAYVNPAALNSGMLTASPGAGVNRRTPSAFYTYVMNGQPRISNPWWDEFHDSWFYKIKFERGHYVCGMESAYLLRTVVS